MVLFFTHMPFVVNHTINATPLERLQQFQQCFCTMRQKRHSLLAFPKFNKEVSFKLQREKHCWSYFAIRRIRLLGLVK